MAFDSKNVTSSNMVNALFPPQGTYVLALEGGGTRCQAALMTSEGNVLYTAENGDVNTNFTSMERAKQSIISAVTSILTNDRTILKKVGLFASALVGPKFGSELFGELFPNAHFLFFKERDVVFARAGIYHPHGVGLVAATGATAFAIRADDGREVSFGGWGSLLGDEGSAYALGLMGLRAAVMAFEGREQEPTRLVEAVCKQYGIELETFHQDLIRLAYQHPISRAEVARLAPAITQLAGEGDEVAKRICCEVASDLSNLALHAAHALFLNDEEFDLVVAGGMTAAGDLILGTLRRNLINEFPNSKFIIGSAPPAEALGRLAIDFLRRQNAHRTVF